MKNAVAEKKSYNKLQQLLIKQLMNEGEVVLTLPGGMQLEIGITQENKYADLVKTKDYCWVIATHSDRTVAMDPHHITLTFPHDENTLVFADHDDEINLA